LRIFKPFLPYYYHNNWTSPSPDTSRNPALLEMNWRFGGTDWHHYSSQLFYYRNMKMKLSSCSETSISFYQTTRCHVRQKSNIPRYRCENLSGDISFSPSHLMVPRAVRAVFVVKRGILCQISKYRFELRLVCPCQGQLIF